MLSIASTTLLFANFEGLNYPSYPTLVRRMKHMSALVVNSGGLLFAKPSCALTSTPVCRPVTDFRSPHAPDENPLRALINGRAGHRVRDGPRAHSVQACEQRLFGNLWAASANEELS